MEKQKTPERGIDSFIKENFYELPSNVDYGEVIIECIDDRSLVERGDIAIRIPGSRLGVLMSAFGAMKILAERGYEIKASSDEIVDAVKDVLKTLDYHTDTSHEDEDLCYAGCGHCAGGFNHPEQYLLTEEDLSVIKNELENSTESKVVVYDGPHNAKGVVIIDDEHIAIPSRGQNGDQYYVYNKSHHMIIMTLIAEAFVGRIKFFNENISLQEVASAFRESAERRLGPTVEHLASHLPKYVVGKEGKEIFIEELGERAPVLVEEN